MTILGRHNCHLTAVNDDQDDPKWTGDAEAFLLEELLKGDAEQSDVWRSYLTIPSNLEVEIEPGDRVFFTWNSQTYGRQVRDVEVRSMFGFIRLHFADR